MLTFWISSNDTSMSVQLLFECTTESGFLGRPKDNPSAKETLTYCARMEIMQTTKSFAGQWIEKQTFMLNMKHDQLWYTGYLQLLLLTGVLWKPICQFSEDGTGFLNTEVVPCHCIPVSNHQQPIHVMWTKLEGAQLMNHIVPLIPWSC